MGNYDRFRVASPGFLQILHPDGQVETLIDGANPTPESKMLIDVNAPSISYDATKIYFFFVGVMQTFFLDE